jgi:hypothetical protein
MLQRLSNAYSTTYYPKQDVSFLVKSQVSKEKGVLQMDETYWLIEMVCDGDRNVARSEMTVNDMIHYYTAYMFVHEEKTTA